GSVRRARRGGLAQCRPPGRGGQQNRLTAPPCRLTRVNLDDFDFDVPPELIAQAPTETRDASRLLRLGRATGNIEHRMFAELPDLLRADDCVVMNDSR